MPSTVSIMLAAGWREMMMMMAGLPLESPAVRMSSTESVTLAISERRTAAPLRKATTSGRYSAALSSWSVVDRDQTRSMSATSPLGRLALAAASAARMSSSPSPVLFRATGLRSTRTAGRAPPPTVTCPTPGT